MSMPSPKHSAPSSPDRPVDRQSLEHLASIDRSVAGIYTLLRIQMILAAGGAIVAVLWIVMRGS